MPTTPAEAAHNLRQLAEENLQIDEATPSQPPSPMETERLYHELQLHQIELEMQNEELRRSQSELESERASYFGLYDLAPVGYLTESAEGLIQKANLATATHAGGGTKFSAQQAVVAIHLPRRSGCLFSAPQTAY